MRGRGWLFVGAAGVALTALSQVDGLSPTVAAAVTVAASVGLALLAHGGAPMASEAVALGAAGALAYEATRSVLPLLATGVLLVFVFGTRAMRSRSVRELALHLGLGFASGVAASWVTQAGAGLDQALATVAVVTAAVLASVPWLVPTDAPRTYALRRLAARAKGPAKITLLRAVLAHRRLHHVELPRRVRRRIDATFDEVCRRAERAVVRGVARGLPVRPLVDQLARVSRAAHSRADAIDALMGSQVALESDSEAIEAEVAALREL